jgi:hypothetical protein
MSKREKEIVAKDFHINIFTYTPSVFGLNKLKFKQKDIFIENKDDYYLRITDQIVK